MNKYIFIILLVIILAVFAGVVFFIDNNKDNQPYNINQIGMTTKGCAEKGGEIVNILDDERADNLEFRRDHKEQFCKNSEDYLGDVAGLKCPCICCKKSITSNFINNQVEKIIIDYLLTQNYFNWKTTANSRNFCVIENLDTTEDGLFPLYIWARCGEFIFQNENIKELSGISTPVKIDYPNELSYYNINKMSYEAPRDGSLRDEDMKRIFPENIRKVISSFNQENIIKKIETIAFNWFAENKK